MKLLYKKLYAGIVVTVLLLLSSSQAFSQQVTITGTVTDAEDGTGLPGVNILVKDAATPIGTVTDFDGNYKLNTTLGSTIVFSFTGYDDKEVLVGSAGVYDVEMGIGDEMLNEVVVIGYGAVVKSDITGSVSKVGEEEFNKGVITSPERLLTGKVSGVQITTDGSPGGGSNIKIRGTTSISADSRPLIVIDGVPIDNDGVAGSRNPLNFVNPADVADITVLKDASAAAIYGSRGANGVIIITTKSGKGKLKVDYTGSLAISDFVTGAPILSASEYRRAIDAKAPQALGDLGDANTNWVDEITQRAVGQQHNLAVSGGYKKLNYYVSMSHEDLKGVLKRDRFRNTKLSANLSTKLLNDNLIVNFRSKSSRNQSTFVPNVINSAMIFDPTQPV
ncbi:MAG: TonB-dependent receptor plug domain-containing protein, partial [Saprospiraceae bacterium]